MKRTAAGSVGPAGQFWTEPVADERRVLPRCSAANVFSTNSRGHSDWRAKSFQGVAGAVFRPIFVLELERVSKRWTVWRGWLRKKEPESGEAGLPRRSPT